jgi:hypothetical protein
MNSSCSICYDNISNNIVSLKCNHHYHLICIYNLIKQKKSYSNKCPLCRLEFLNPIYVIKDNHIDIIEYEEIRRKHTNLIFILLLTHFIYLYINIFYFDIFLQIFSTMLYGFLTGYYFVLVVWK